LRINIEKVKDDEGKEEDREEGPSGDEEVSGE